MSTCDICYRDVDDGVVCKDCDGHTEYEATIERLRFGLKASLRRGRNALKGRKEARAQVERILTALRSRAGWLDSLEAAEAAAKEETDE